MHFYLPRRYRRRLLLPPGFLALTGLLLLGCLALESRLEESRRPITAMELAVLPRTRSNSDLIWPPLSELDNCVWPKKNEPMLRYSNLSHYRNWSTLEFSQGQNSDTLTIHQLKKILQELHPSGNWRNNGLRIYFGPHAHYDTLVTVLDLLGRYKSQYFSDFRFTPVTRLVPE